MQTSSNMEVPGLLKYLVLYRSSDKSVKIWDAGTRQCIHTFYEHTDQVAVACFAIDASFVNELICCLS